MLDERHLARRLTDAEREQFEEEGYIVVESAIPPDIVAGVEEAIRRALEE